MPFDYSVLQQRTWLCEPVALRRAIARVASYKACYSPREVAKLRAAERRRADALPGLALAGTGVDVETPAGQAAGPNKAIRAVKGKVGVIGIYGPIDQRMSSELEKAEGTSCTFISRAFDRLMEDPAVDAIVFDVDSPGGYSYGIQELADKIYNARGQKALYACANSMACSAAYWLATSASILCVTPGGDVGSVGVYAAHVDRSAQLADDGVAVTLVQAGRYKTEFADSHPLSDDAKAWLQGRVDADYAKFTAALARNRGVTAKEVQANFGQGRVVAADEAVRLNMADRVLSLDQLLDRLIGVKAAGGQGSSGGRSASADILRRRQEHRLRQSAGLRRLG